MRFSLLLVGLSLTLTSSGFVFITETGVDSLLHLRKFFYREDVDDDLRVEPDDYRQIKLRVDTNHDDTISLEEMKMDPFFKTTITMEEYLNFDLDGDGSITTKDFDIKIHDLLSAKGNDIDLKEYLQFMAVNEESQGEIMQIDSFVYATKNFQVSDLDDDEILSEYEYKAEFGVADANFNSFLEVNEIDAFRPTRHVDANKVCSDKKMTSTGCDMNDVMVLFNTSDTNNDMSLSLDEYVKYFGELMEN
ncbi:hypothetical protein SNE40_005842 [Patella caerulea]|uniref:EF-hand domain-containing protein n=1 Tax=Patella caerulea TaxID=87958 RepID=A0AAN8JXR7_PATCE